MVESFRETKLFIDLVYKREVSIDTLITQTRIGKDNYYIKVLNLFQKGINLHLIADAEYPVFPWKFFKPGGKS